MNTTSGFGWDTMSPERLEVTHEHLERCKDAVTWLQEHMGDTDADMPVELFEELVHLFVAFVQCTYTLVPVKVVPDD